MRRSILLAVVTLFAASNLIPYAVGADDWTYDWSTRTDRDGQPAGIFTTTPVPVTETTTSYSIANDEGTKTFTLGTKYYVDGLDGNDSYNGLSLVTAKQTISAAVSAAGSGNKTIIVRGAHDGWDGIYYESSIRLRAGTDDSNRWLIVGYGQERPVVDGGNTSLDVFNGTGQINAYATLQRLKIQNSKNQGIRLGDLNTKKEQYFNLIDVEIYNCNNDSSIVDDGNVYLLNVDHGWFYHVKSTHSFGHAAKIGDGSSDVLVEWSVFGEAGYWEPWTGPSSYWGTHASALDFPNDSNIGFRITARYNIIFTSLFYGVQIRRVLDYDFHHNEIFDTPHFNDIAQSESHSIGSRQIILYAGQSSGKFNNNIVRDPGSTGTDAVHISETRTNSPEHLTYNNMFYGGHRSAIRIENSNTGSSFGIFNNSVYGESSSPLLYNGMGSAAQVHNNIVFQNGTGSCVSLGAADHTYNRYYYPFGARGVTLSVGESDGDPLWDDIPSQGLFGYSDFAMSEHIPGADLTSYFTDDFAGRFRLFWDVGALEAIPDGPDLIAPAPPTNVQVSTTGNQ